mmetsp:Transcript_2362/g.6863  ORF Transcript_2362/g.6863 Transcript_2362/m.6863 type:complete len:206 (-) Transcript_2362:163-780(-)
MICRKIARCRRYLWPFGRPPWRPLNVKLVHDLATRLLQLAIRCRIESINRRMERRSVGFGDSTKGMTYLYARNNPGASTLLTTIAGISFPDLPGSKSSRKLRRDAIERTSRNNQHTLRPRLLFTFHKCVIEELRFATKIKIIRPRLHRRTDEGHSALPIRTSTRQDNTCTPHRLDQDGVRPAPIIFQGCNDDGRMGQTQFVGHFQ